MLNRSCTSFKYCFALSLLKSPTVNVCSLPFASMYVILLAAPLFFVSVDSLTVPPVNSAIWLIIEASRSDNKSIEANLWAILSLNAETFSSVHFWSSVSFKIPSTSLKACCTLVALLITESAILSFLACTSAEFAKSLSL